MAHETVEDNASSEAGICDWYCFHLLQLLVAAKFAPIEQRASSFSLSLPVKEVFVRVLMQWGGINNKSINRL